MASKLIPEEIINEIRHQTDIVEVISEYVALTKTGVNYRGFCPFHQEKTPSFFVSPQKQIFHCYGCGVGGNVFTFLMQSEKYTFPEAVRFLAKRLGIAIPTKSDETSKQQLGRLDALYALHSEVVQYFTRQLTQHPQGRKALQYLQNRGIGEKIIQTFSLGYALSGWDDLRNAFIQRYPLDLLLQSGLIIKKKNGVGQYDRFRDRLIIPIHDDRGRVVAFGGRILGEGEPKYLNSPESPIFQKGRILFGLHRAKEMIRRAGSIILVEGYFDMIVPYSYGMENIAATMGTALTEHHLRLLQQYTKKVIVVFDPDPTGIKAVQRTLDLFLESGFEVRAAILRKGEDPDTTIRKMGVESFLQAINHAPLLLDFIRERIIEHYDLSQSEQRIQCANQILPTIVKIQNIPERNEQIYKTADLLRITEADQAIFEEFKKVARTGKPQISHPIPKKRAALPPLERYLIEALVQDKSLIPVVKEALEPAELTHPVTQKIVQELFVYNDKTDFEARILDMFRETDYHTYLANLFMQADEIVDPAATVRDCVYRLRQKQFEDATLNSTKRLRDAQEKKNRELLETFFKQKNEELQQKQQKFHKKSEFPLEK